MSMNFRPEYHVVLQFPEGYSPMGDQAAEVFKTFEQEAKTQKLWRLPRFGPTIKFNETGDVLDAAKTHLAAHSSGFSLGKERAGTYWIIDNSIIWYVQYEIEKDATGKAITLATGDPDFAGTFTLQVTLWPV